MSRDLITATHEYLGRIHDQITTHAETLPDGSKRKLARNLEKLFRFAMDDYFKQIEGQPPDQIEFLSRLFIDSADQLVKFFFPLFESPDLSLVLNHLTLPLVSYSPPDSECVALIPASEEVNFGTQMFRLRWAWNVLASNASVQKLDLDDTLNYFISYPQPLANDLLSLTILGHEVAHVWFSSTGADQEISQLIELDSSALAEGAREVGAEPASLEESDYYFDVQQKALKWAEEIVCDIVATYVLGPTILFAFERTMQLSGGHKDSLDLGKRIDTHPDSRWRCRIMLDQLSSFGYPLKFQAADSEELRGTVTELQRLAERDLTYVPTFTERGDRIIYDAIESARSELHKRVAQKIRIDRFQFIDAFKNVPAVVKTFENGHIVSDSWQDDINTALQTSSIVLALWETYLRQRMDESVDARELRLYEMNLASEIARALSGAETLRRWQN